MDKEIKEKLINIVALDNNVVALYDYGSTVYKTRNENSDTDVILVVIDNKDVVSQSILEKYMDVNVFDKNEFEQMIKEHEITALECVFLENEFKWKETTPWNFELNLPVLRNAISSKSSNSWVKAKKKFLVEKDFNPYIGKKSAWHAIRILDFGHQIGEKGTIYNFAKVNNFLKEIIDCSSWEEIDGKFRKIYNEASSKFKLVAPKEIVISNKPKI